MRKGNETGMRGASEYGNSTITNYRHKENLNISYNEEKTFSFMLYRTMLFLSLRVYTFAFIIHPLLFASVSGSESTNSMEECITTTKLVFLSIFTPMDRQKCFTRMERWLLNSRDRKIENVIIEVKYQRVLIGIDNLVESCKLVGRGNYC